MKQRKGIWDPAFPFDPRRTPIFYGWIIAAAGALAIIASIPGQTMGVNVFSEELIRDLGLTRLDVSLAYLIGTAVSGFALPFVGGWYDRMGARRLIVLASVGLGLSLYFLSVSDRIADALSRSVGFGDRLIPGRFGFLTLGFFFIRFWGQGIITLVARNMVGKWWQAHRGKVLSISGISVSVFFSLSPKAFDWLVQTFEWREAWQILGTALLVGFSFIAWLVFRDNPEECGLKADGGRPATARSGDPDFTIVKEFTRKEAIGTYSFWLFSFVFALQAYYFTAFTFHVISVGEEVGLGKDAALDLFLPAAILGGLLSLFVGWASDRFRLKRFILLMSIGIGLTPAGFISRDPVALTILVTIGLGIASGCFGTLSGAFMPRFFGLKHLGAISGLFMSLLVLASAVGPWLFSVAKDSTGSYAAAHWMALLTAAALAVGSFWADNPQRKLAARKRNEPGV